MALFMNNLEDDKISNYFAILIVYDKNRNENSIK